MTVGKARRLDSTVPIIMYAGHEDREVIMAPAAAPLRTSGKDVGEWTVPPAWSSGDDLEFSAVPCVPFSVSNEAGTPLEDVGAGHRLGSVNTTPLQSFAEETLVPSPIMSYTWTGTPTPPLPRPSPAAEIQAMGQNSNSYHPFQNALKHQRAGNTYMINGVDTRDGDSHGWVAEERYDVEPDTPGYSLTQVQPIAVPVIYLVDPTFYMGDGNASQQQLAFSSYIGGDYQAAVPAKVSAATPDPMSLPGDATVLKRKSSPSSLRPDAKPRPAALNERPSSTQGPSNGRVSSPNVTNGAHSKLHLNMSCDNCSTSNTSLWRRGVNGENLCNACALYYKFHHTARPISFKTDVIKKRRRGSGSDSASNHGGRKKRSRPVATAS